MVALTNQRLLALYERQVLKLLPPSLEIQVSRHQTEISAIGEYGTVRTKRPTFLIAGLVIFLWYPVGTFIACILVALFFAVPRPEIQISTGGQRRRYPLALADQEDLLRNLDRLTEGNPQVSRLDKMPRKTWF
jgi:hypothetical protein